MTTLKVGQQRRAEALRIARELLAVGASQSIVTRSGGGLPEYREVGDLVDLARFITRDEHPLDAYRTGDES